VLICACRRSGDGLWWRPTRSRNSRPELIADDEENVVLPTRSFTWARGRPAGGCTVPPQGWVLHWTHIGPIDSVMPKKTQPGCPGVVCQVRFGVASKGSSQTLLQRCETSPRLTGRFVRSVSRYRANFAFPPSPEPDAPPCWRQASRGCARDAHWASIACQSGGLGWFQKPSIQRLLPPAL
jgi:hypothetical protein